MSKGIDYRYINKETFVELFLETKIPIPEATFDKLDIKQKGKLDIFQIMSILIWTSFANKDSKLRCNLLHYR